MIAVHDAVSCGEWDGGDLTSAVSGMFTLDELDVAENFVNFHFRNSDLTVLEMRQTALQNLSHSKGSRRAAQYYTDV